MNYEESVKLLNIKATEKSVYKKEKKISTGLSFWHEIVFKILAAWRTRELNLEM